MDHLRSAGGVLRHMRGYIPDTKDHRDRFFTAAPSLVLPAASSLRGLGSPIRDQGQIGSCTGNSSTEAMGYLYLKAGLPDPIFSRLFAYYFGRVLDGDAATDDSGCQIRNIIKALAAYGVPPESVWPYTAGFSSKPLPSAMFEAVRHKVLFYYRVPNLFTLKASIAQGFPVVFGVSVPDNMMSDACAASGEVQYPAKTEGFDGGHAILAIGYDDATRRVTFQNSWGEGWGDKGFGTLPYEMFDDGFVDDCWTIRREEM